MSATLLAFLISKTFNLFVKIVISADRPEQGRGNIAYVKNEIKCEKRLQNVDLENARTLNVYVPPPPPHTHKWQKCLTGILYRHPNETFQ